MRHGRAAVGRGRRPWSPLELRVSRSFGVVGHGVHGGTLRVAGEATAGELRHLPRRRSRLLCSSVDDMRARFAGGPQLSASIE